jgi:hypothetical protein
MPTRVRSWLQLFKPPSRRWLIIACVLSLLGTSLHLLSPFTARYLHLTLSYFPSNISQRGTTTDSFHASSANAFQNAWLVSSHVHEPDRRILQASHINYNPRWEKPPPKPETPRQPPGPFDHLFTRYPVEAPVRGTITRKPPPNIPVSFPTWFAEAYYGWPFPYRGHAAFHMTQPSPEQIQAWTNHGIRVTTKFPSVELSTTLDFDRTLWLEALKSWLVFQLPAVLIVLASTFKNPIKLRRIAQGLCPTCRYPTTGLTRCPECGTPITTSLPSPNPTLQSWHSIHHLPLRQFHSPMATSPPSPQLFGHLAI